MKRGTLRRSLCLGLLALGLYFSENVQASAVTIDNDGTARDIPYGDSKLPSSYSGVDYYDCYYPYALSIADIGGYANGVLAYKCSAYNFTMQTERPSAIGKPFSTTCMYEFDKSGSTIHNCSIYNEVGTKMNIAKDSNGNEYYITAIQNFFYNFGGLAMAQGKGFASFEESRGQLVDVILTDGTCIHFLVGDTNATGHTNGGPATTQDVTYSFAPLVLSQYKNIFQAANGNSLELWGSNGCTQAFKDKYNLKEEGNKIAYYRMYNADVISLPTRNTGVGTSVSYSMGDATVSSSGNTSVKSVSSLVSEWELVGMPSKSELLEKQHSIVLPTRDDLSIGESNSVSIIKESLAISNSANAFDKARISLVFIGLCIVVYGGLLFVAMLFDRVNSFLDINLVGVLTLGRLVYNGEDDGTENLPKGVVSTKKMLVNVLVIIATGLLVLSNGVLPMLTRVALFIAEKML